MGSSLKARIKALSKDDSSTKQTGLVIAPFVSKEEQSCVNSIGSTRALVKEHAEGRPVATSFGSAATGFLTLPFISRHVPVTSVIDEGDGRVVADGQVVRRAG